MIRVLMMCLIFLSCGEKDTVVQEREVPVFPPGCDKDGCKPEPPPPGGDPINYAEMQGLMNQFCAKCHASASFMVNERNLRASPVYDWIYTNRMPPQGAPQIPQTFRQDMLNWF